MDAPKNTVQAVKYRLKGGASSVTHQRIGDITNEHLSGPHAHLFISAIKKCDAKGQTKGFYEQFIEEVK